MTQPFPAQIAEARAAAVHSLAAVLFVSRLLGTGSSQAWANSGIPLGIKWSGHAVRYLRMVNGSHGSTTGHYVGM